MMLLANQICATCDGKTKTDINYHLQPFRKFVVKSDILSNHINRNARNTVRARALRKGAGLRSLNQNKRTERKVENIDGVHLSHLLCAILVSKVQLYVKDTG